MSKAKTTPPKPKPKTINKPKRRPYQTAEGDRVPSVTTIISHRQDCGGLIHWAWDLGTKGIDYRDEREDAANVGAIAHRLVETDIHDQFYVPPSAKTLSVQQGIPIDKAKAVLNSFSAWRSWKDETNFTIKQTEVRLTSDIYRFGGTFDACMIRRKRSLADWKTSSGIYLSHIVQLAAYGLLWKEAHPCNECHNGVASLGWVQDATYFKKYGHHPPCPKCKGYATTKPLLGGYHLVRFDKDTGAFEYRHFPASSIDLAERLFLKLRDLYEVDKEANKLYKAK